MMAPNKHLKTVRAEHRDEDQWYLMEQACLKVSERIGIVEEDDE
jgi:hypothetical protein